jgi:bifunctional non-homologous end joining protein LigD
MGEHVKHVPVKEKRRRRPGLSLCRGRARNARLRADGDDRIPRLGQQGDKLEYPDRLVFDLDPDVGLDFAKVKEAAVRLRALLADLGLVTSRC